MLLSVYTDDTVTNDVPHCKTCLPALKPKQTKWGGFFYCACPHVTTYISGIMLEQWGTWYPPAHYTMTIIIDACCATLNMGVVAPQNGKCHLSHTEIYCLILHQGNNIGIV